MSRTDNHNENTNYINVEYFFHIIFNTEMSGLSIDDIDFHDAKKSMKIHKNSISIYNFKIIIHEKKSFTSITNWRMRQFSKILITFIVAAILCSMIQKV